MVLKSKDDVGPAVAELDRLLTLRLTEQQRRDIEGEKATLRAGAKAEQEAAYLIDFELKDSKHWVVLHDLRFEHKGRVAQIDRHIHVLKEMIRDLGLAPRFFGAVAQPMRLVGREICESCGQVLTHAEAYYCRINKARFAGARLCRKCQALAPRGERQTQAPKASNRGRVSGAGQPSPVATAVCSSCGTPVDPKVVAYCRFNSKRFDGKTLCRSCQAKPAR